MPLVTGVTSCSHSEKKAAYRRLTSLSCKVERWAGVAAVMVQCRAVRQAVRGVLPIKVRYCAVDPMCWILCAPADKRLCLCSSQHSLRNHHYSWSADRVFATPTTSPPPGTPFQSCARSWPPCAAPPGGPRCGPLHRAAAPPGCQTRQAPPPHPAGGTTQQGGGGGRGHHRAGVQEDFDVLSTP
jgi:hypothetical protein